MSGQVFIKETMSLVMNLEDERRFPWFCLPYYATSCDLSTNGGVKKLIASCYMEMLCSLKTSSESYCRQQTKICQDVFVQDVTIGCDHFPSLDTPVFIIREATPGLLNWPDFCVPLLLIFPVTAFPSPALTFTLKLLALSLSLFI